MGIDLIQSFLQQATAQGSRSTAMNPLGWALGITVSALLIATRIPNAPGWMLSLLGGLAVLVLIAFLVAYFILLFRDRDALRSERFTLSKMALEKSITGDSLRGFVEFGEQRVTETSVVPSPENPGRK